VSQTTRLFLSVDNLEMVSGRKVCYMSKVSKFCLEKSRVGFLPAETCFCHASGLNRQKLGSNRQKPDLNCRVFKHAQLHMCT